jgi:glycosyltransferase involved in cell wall biosynthesis
MFKISCIIPTLNRSTVLLDTIRMLFAQSYPAHEIIIVDQTLEPDEETRRILTEWNQQRKVRWLRQKEPNASKARNALAAAARDFDPEVLRRRFWNSICDCLDRDAKLATI